MSVHSLLLAMALFCSAIGFSQSNAALFAQATELYNQGKYAKAIANYEQILQNGEHSTALYYNLGNCYYKRSAIGPSIYYYEKALLLDPNDTEIRNNLRYAQNMRLDAIEELPPTQLAQLYYKVVYLFSIDQWAYGAVVGMLLFVLAYWVYVLRHSARHKRIAFTTSVVCLVLCGLSLALAYAHHQEVQQQNPAIIFSEAVQVAAEPNTNSEVLFSLHQGTKVNVVDHLNSWSKIRLANGQMGWIKRDALRLIKDF